MARCQQTKGMGWQSAGSMKNTASLGLRERETAREREHAREGGEKREELGGEESEKEKEKKRGRKKAV